MQGIRQVLEGEGFRHAGQRLSLMGTLMVPFWWHAVDLWPVHLAMCIRDLLWIAWWTGRLARMVRTPSGPCPAVQQRRDQGRHP